VVISCAALATQAEELPQTLLLIDEPTVEAVLEAAEQDGGLQFRIGDDLRQIARENLVRWSTPAMATAAGEVLLVDGSRLVLAESWTGQPSLKMDARTVSAATKQFGKITFPRVKLRAVLFHAPADVRRRTKQIDRLLAWRGDDRLLLSNQDVLTGKLLGIAENQPADGDHPPGATVVFEADIGKLKLPQARVAGVVCNPGQGSSSSGALAVGLRDGSYLMARSLTADAHRLRVELACGVTVSGTNCRDVVYLQSLAGRLVYLSDIKPADYRHEPYLDIPWPYRTDRNVLGGPLVVDRRWYAKGLGMHSASRLTYRLEADPTGSRYERFAAEIAVDDAAAGRGSVLFRVYLFRANAWQLAYASPVVRGGEASLPVSVDLKDARRIALETDYADHGDERDYANWLDARLEESNP